MQLTVPYLRRSRFAPWIYYKYFWRFFNPFPGFFSTNNHY